MSYGHGISVTLIQMARAYLAFARDGDIVPLSLAKLEGLPPAGQNVFSAQTAHEVRVMLEMAVQPGGTAPRAQIAGYRTAGKTGTAYKVEAGAYAQKYVSSFVGFAPASDPRLIIAVMIDEPLGKDHFGGDVAAPVFAQVMAGSLRSLGVAPDAPLKPLQVVAAQ
jgi:cell division protein FtsI (penicillin-binding protein 3)